MTLKSLLLKLWKPDGTDLVAVAAGVLVADVPGVLDFLGDPLPPSKTTPRIATTMMTSTTMATIIKPVLRFFGGGAPGPPG